MRICVVVGGTLQGTGYANRVTSMVQWYARRGHVVDVVHFAFPHERTLPEVCIREIHDYTVIDAGVRRRLTARVSLDLRIYNVFDEI